MGSFFMAGLLVPLTPFFATKNSIITEKCKESAFLLSEIQVFPKQENAFSNRQATEYEAVLHVISFEEIYLYRQKY